VFNKLYIKNTPSITSLSGQKMNNGVFRLHPHPFYQPLGGEDGSYLEYPAKIPYNIVN